MSKEITLTKEQKLLGAKLTPLRYRLVINVLAGMSQRQAYLAAGGKAKSGKVQDNTASQIMSVKEVQEFYRSLLETKIEESLLTRTEALSILSANARAKMTDIAEFEFRCVGKDKDGKDIMQTVWRTKDSNELSPELASCIKSVTMTKQGAKIELHDQQAAIRQISTMQGWDAPKKSELTGAGGTPLAIRSEVSAPEVADALNSLLDKL